MVYVKSQNIHSETWSDKNIKVNNSGDKTKTRNKNKNYQGKNKESPCTSQSGMILCQYTRSSLFQNLFKEQDKWQVKYNQICDASDYACSWTPHYTWMLGWYLSEAIKYSPLHNII